MPSQCRKYRSGEYVFCRSCFQKDSATKPYGGAEAAPFRIQIWTADSNILRTKRWARTDNLARTPKGSVMLPDVTCPDFTPKATGTPNSPTIRLTTSGRV